MSPSCQKTRQAKLSCSSPARVRFDLYPYRFMSGSVFNGKRDPRIMTIAMLTVSSDYPMPDYSKTVSVTSRALKNV
jgi:hypothetical protein